MRLNLLTSAAAALPLWARRLAAPAPRPIRRLLILGYGAIGDTIFFLPVLEALRRILPQASIIWVSNPAAVAGKLIPATGLVNDIWLWDFEGQEGCQRRGEIVRRLKNADFDAAILTLSTPAHYFQEALASIPLIAAHRFPGLALRHRLVLGELSRAALGARTMTRLGAEHTARRNMRLLEAFGNASSATVNPRPRLPIGPRDRERASNLMVSEQGRPWVGVHLGPPTSYNFRAWAPEKFGSLCAELSRAWPEAKFALIGGPEEAPSALRALQAGPADLVNLIGKTSLLESFALIERCALMLACDTGLSKASMALGVPTVTLWGPSSPLESGILWDAERHLDLSVGLPCSPCSFSGMPRNNRLNYRDCGHHACLTRMDVAWVKDRVLSRWPELPKK